MKVKDVIFEAERFEAKANNYYNRNYSTYMGCWMHDSSEEEYLKLKQDLFDYLDSEV